MRDEWYGVASYLVWWEVLYEQESTCEYDCDMLEVGKTL